MNTSTITYVPRRTQILLRLADYVELTKPKIALLELVAVAAAAFCAGPDPVILFHVLVGTSLVAASASAMNQWLERGIDCRMPRTADRPLAEGRMHSVEGLLFGLVTVILGIAYLAFAVNLLTCVLGLVTWILYVLVYTPLKSRTTANTLIGAVAGALPVLMGWAAMGTPLGVRAATLFMILFLWQFPHFMAIAWIYRREYGNAGLQMLTVVDPTGRRAGGLAVVASLALVPVSLLPAVALSENVSIIYFGLALTLGLAQFGTAVSFLVRRDDSAAKWLLRASLIYLPALLLLIVVTVP